MQKSRKIKPLISIVIPAYNVEKYIAQCIESINKQTFDDYEVIIVDDGSTDKTLDIIKDNITDKYQVISQKNYGAGAARNAGIKLATGKYLTFMDADDFLYTTSCLQKIANIIKLDQYDVVTYKMIRYYQNSNKYMIEDDLAFENNNLNNIKDYLIASIACSRLSVSPCDKIIKTDIVKKNKIYFKKMLMLEDIDWSLRLYNYVDNIMVYNEPIYVYRKERIDSTTSFYTKEKVDACLNFVSNWCYNCEKNIGDYSKLYLHYIAYQYTILIGAVNKKNTNNNSRNLLKNYAWLIKYDLNFKVRKVRKVYDILGYKAMVITLKAYMILKNKNLILIR